MTAHELARLLVGSQEPLLLPLCWDADARRVYGPDYDTELWFLSWDHGAIDPLALTFATAPESVTCRDCITWRHA